MIASALYLVQTQYAARRLFTELDQAIAKNRQLEEERERLQVEQRANRPRCALKNWPKSWAWKRPPQR